MFCLPACLFHFDPSARFRERTNFTVPEIIASYQSLAERFLGAGASRFFKMRGFISGRVGINKFSLPAGFDSLFLESGGLTAYPQTTSRSLARR